MAEGRGAPETAEEFASRMTTTVSSGFVTLAISIGVRTGLFGHLGEMDGPRTSGQIAEAAGMKERYVREWLAVMVTARIVEYDRQRKTYFLPRYKLEVLLSDEGEGSAGSVSEFFRQLVQVAGDVAECFKMDGPRGVPYSAYPEFQGWVADMRQQELQDNMVDKFLPTIPGLAELLDSGVRVLDAGCGRGITMIILAQHFPKSSFVGTDISEGAIQWAVAESKRLGLSNVTFQVQDMARMPADWSESFDYILVWDAVHDLAEPEIALREIFRMVRPGGRFSMVDIRGHSELADNMADPAAPTFYGFSLLHCMPVSLYAGGRGLGTMWGQELAVQMLHEAGFVDIRVLDVPKSPGQLHFLSHKP